MCSDSFLKPLDIYTFDKVVGWQNGANGRENTEQGSHSEQKVVGEGPTKPHFYSDNNGGIVSLASVFTMS